MSIEKNKGVIRRLFEIVTSHDLSLLEEVCSEDLVYSNPEVGEIRGIGGYREELHEAIATFPDLEASVEFMLAEGDHVCSVHRARGTHEGDYDGIPPHGRCFDLLVSDLFTLRDHKIVEHREFYDVLTILKQVGAASEAIHPGGHHWPRGGTVLRPG